MTAHSTARRLRRLVVLMATLVLAVSMVVAVAAPNTTRYAFIARGDNPIDALAAAPIAGRLNSPVLLTPPTTLSDATRQGLLDRDPDVVIIAGGTAAVSDDVMAAIEQLLPDAQVLRVSGTSRYTTAQQLAALVATIDPAFATTEGNDTNAYGIACPDGHTLTAITDTGQPDCAPDQVDHLERWCELVAANPASYPATVCTSSLTLASLDTSDGLVPSLAIGIDGLPVIAYYDVATGDIHLVHCTNPACTTHDTPETLDALGITGWTSYTSIAIGTDGFPIVAYMDVATDDLMVVHCTDPACTTHDSPQGLDTTGQVGFDPTIAIGSDGLPIIAYRDGTNTALKIVRCSNLACTTRFAPKVLDSTGDVGSHTAIAIGTDGLPIITYRDTSNTALKVVHCTNTACTTHATPQTLDNAGDVGSHTAIAIGTDGHPIITYRDTSNTALKVLHCTSSTCATHDAPQTVDSAGSAGWYTAIAMGTDGRPVVAYYDHTDDTLKVATLR